MPLKVTSRKVRGKTQYVLRGTVEGGSGRPVFKSLGSNKEQAKRIAQQLIPQLIDEDLTGRVQDWTFADAAREYMDKVGKDRAFVEKLVEHCGQRKLAHFQPGDVIDIANQLYKERKPATRNRNAIGPFMAIHNFAAHRGKVSPIKVKKLKEGRVKRQHVDRTWINTFREHCKHPGVRALALFYFTTGARRGEGVKLKVDGFDFEKRTATVKTKNGDEHSFLLTAELALEMKNLAPVNGHVFGLESPRSVNKLWDATCKAAGILRVPPHQAGRHSFATLLIEERHISPKKVAQLGNWKSVSLLMDRYVHTDEDGSIVEEAFGSGPKLKIVGE